MLLRLFFFFCVVMIAPAPSGLSILLNLQVPKRVGISLACYGFQIKPESSGKLWLSGPLAKKVELPLAVGLSVLIIY